MKIYDQHIHSYYSHDSKEKIENYLDKTRKLGLDFFVLTDHVDYNYANFPYEYVNFFKQHEELDKLQNIYPDIKILKGVEIGYGDDVLDKIRALLLTHCFDLVNLSLHALDGVDYCHKELIDKYGIDTMLRKYFCDYEKLVNSDIDYDVCCHIDYAFKSAYLFDNSLKIDKYENELMNIMKDIIKKDKTLEINVKVQSYINDEHTRFILSLYKMLGGKNITLSSDAHSVDRLCENFDYYIALIKEAGFDHLNYFINRERYDLGI